MKKLVAAALAAVAFATADACTGIYVGKKVSVEGNVLIGRTIDSSKAVVGKAINLLGRVENAPGRYYSGGNDRGGWPLPDTTWKCLMTPQVNMRHAFRYDSACLNEKGVALSGTVTGATNEEALKADPFMKEGFGESSVVGLLALSCSTAREVVELLGKVVGQRHVKAHILVLTGLAGVNKLHRRKVGRHSHRQRRLLRFLLAAA